MWTCGSRPGVMPGGNSSAMHSGSVRYTSFSSGQPAISAGRIIGASVVMVTPKPSGTRQSASRFRPEHAPGEGARRPPADLHGHAAHDRGAVATFGPPEARPTSREIEDELVRLVV